MTSYQAKLSTPFAVLGIRTSGELLVAVDFLPLADAPMSPQDKTAEVACREFAAYLEDPEHRLHIPMAPRGTAFQQRVWRALSEIPAGTTKTYGDLASLVGSAPRAVGQACGANPVPIVIPCHRVLARDGGLGGFMNALGGDPLAIKRWLLRHERALD